MCSSRTIQLNSVVWPNCWREWWEFREERRYNLTVVLNTAGCQTLIIKTIVYQDTIIESNLVLVSIYLYSAVQGSGRVSGVYVSCCLIWPDNGILVICCHGLVCFTRFSLIHSWSYSYAIEGSGRKSRGRVQIIMSGQTIIFNNDVCINCWLVLTFLLLFEMSGGKLWGGGRINVNCYFFWLSGDTYLGQLLSEYQCLVVFFTFEGSGISFLRVTVTVV